MDPLPINTVLLGSCEDVLKGFPDAYFDACVTDPPYGLGTKEPTGRDIELYLQGKPLDTGGDFMGKPWEIPSVPTWREVYRVLKPGGYVLSFAGTRTWDIMSVGLRAAGFDNRDTISQLFSSPCLQWIHGQGFPKSLNIAKKLREMGDKLVKEGAPQEEIIKVYAAAVRFDGWGTALKPAWEPILCFRRPFDASTVPAQIILMGTGGINIDGTRVRHASPEDFAKHKEQVDRIKEKGGKWGDSWKNSSDLSGASDVTLAGRWPPNAVLMHASGCKVVGTRKVDAPVINRFTDGMKPFGDGAGHPYETIKTGDENGEEEIPVYECIEGCPVKAIDAATPEASKFFAQFTPDAPFFYTGKASKREKNKGVMHHKFHDGFVAVKDDLKPEEKALLEAEWPKDYPDPTSPIMEEAIQEFSEALKKLFVEVKPDDNKHPTVKPVALMRWLVKLVTPKGGTVLDPYCGSGTTCAAAIEEDVKYVGIDKDPLFHKLAKKRVDFLLQEAEEFKAQRAAFDMMDELPQE